MNAKISLAVAAALLLAAAPAAAEGSKRLEPFESKGWGDKIGRLGLSAYMVSGASEAGVSGGTVRQDFTRNHVDLDFDLFGFWDATRFDTLIGADTTIKLGLHGAPKTDAPSAEPKDDGYALFVRWDAAMDYGLVHWDGSMRGRLGFGAGFGMDYDSKRWYSAGGRIYPLLLARVQLWMGDSFGLHFAYHWVPTTTNDRSVREHRFEAGVGLGAFHGGARVAITSVTAQDPSADALITREIGAFVAYAF